VKLVELLHANSEGLNIGVLYRANRTELDRDKETLEIKANDLGAHLVPKDVVEENDIKEAFRKEFKDVDGVLVTADSFFNNRRKLVIDMANKRKIPSIFQWREFCELGGLMSYGPSLQEAYFFSGLCAARILKGEHAYDIDVASPTQIEHVVNQTTLDALELTAPDSWATTADYVD